MKKLFVLVGLSVGTMFFAGCANNQSSSEMAQLRTAVEEARSAAIQANENAAIARQLAEQNAEKINRVFRSNQRK